ncbi:hypothetical protein BC936DRAFT_145100 [Jimgerdemannia flammicorona]|uniref:Zinc finger HIT domain-containing protein n=1 Tax=Jimgerdemannia flammicorona TaxID=994334 RepID=A0A433DLU7_9FUNG|nr:hypothetical protein BC936DRAFT_145100 [Jimgerdemannia flammicorona]
MATLPTKPNCRVCEQNPSKYKCPNFVRCHATKSTKKHHAKNLYHQHKVRRGDAQTSVADENLTSVITWNVWRAVETNDNEHYNLTRFSACHILSISHHTFQCLHHLPRIASLKSVPRKTKYSAASTAADEDSETALRDEQLRKLATSDKLRDFLRYPQIRALIAEIDGGADPEVLLDRARENDPVFAEFAEEALDTVLGSWRGQEDA